MVVGGAGSTNWYASQKPAANKTIAMIIVMMESFCEVLSDVAIGVLCLYLIDRFQQ